MSDRFPIVDEDLHALLDGELEAARALEVEQAVQADPALAARLDAFDADKSGFAALYAPIADMPLPAAWLARIENATAPSMPVSIFARANARRARPVIGLAFAACLAILAFATLLRPHTAVDTILADAAMARRDETPALMRLSGATLLDAAARDTALRRAVGLNLHAPDLSGLHWHLAELETYRHAAALRYRSDSGQALTVYLRQSAGAPRFDLLKEGSIRTCIWQDEVVGAVMMGDMSAGQMMRVASAAYLALEL